MKETERVDPVWVEKHVWVDIRIRGLRWTIPLCESHACTGIAIGEEPRPHARIGVKQRIDLLQCNACQNSHQPPKMPSLAVHGIPKRGGLVQGTLFWCKTHVLRD